MLFGLPFILAGVAVGLFVYYPMISSWWSAYGWVEVPCWIEKAEMKFFPGSKGTSAHQIEAVYRYEFERRPYHGDQVGDFGGSDKLGSSQEEALEQLQASKNAGRPFRCFVNPSKPEQSVLFRDLRWPLLLILSIFPTVFPLAGCLVSIGGWRQSRRAAKITRLSEQHPTEPWRWRPEWMGEKIRPAPDNLSYILGVAGWIVLVQLPLALAVIVGRAIATSPLALLALLPCLLALIPLYFAWMRVKSRMAFGHPALLVSQMPLSPGRALKGELQFDRVPSPLGSMDVRVLCQRHITCSSGDTRTMAKETVWESTQTLSASEARRDFDGVVLPLHIDLPRGLPCSVVDEASIVTTDGETHVWTLEIKSSQGGKAVVLPLPVFTSADSESVSEAVPDQMALLSMDDLVLRLQARGIQMELDENDNPSCIICPLGRNLHISLFLLVFGSLWLTAFWFLSAQGAPLIFRLFWGITSPLILGIGVWLLLHSRHIEIVAREMRILNRLGPFYSWCEILEPRHFTGFTHDSNLQSGNQFYYRVRGETVFGKTKTLVDGITESITAETLAKRLEEWRRKEAAG